MVRKFMNLLLLPLCSIVIYLAYFETLIDFKRNSDDSIPQKHEEIHLHASNKSEEISQEHKTKSLELIQNGIFWSDCAESLVPKGPQLNDSMVFVRNIRHAHVKKITHAKHNICGSGKNGIAELKDGTTLCVRYERKYHHIFAEALAFYLSRLLGMDNVPEVVLSRVNRSTEQWKTIDFQTMEWEENKEVAMMKWLNNTRLKVFMPLAIQNAYTTGNPVTSQVIHDSPLTSYESSYTAELIQWGTLILFDNLIGHTDRLFHYLPVNEGGKGSRSINGSLRNSIKSPNGKIWLIDNESGFFYGNHFENQIEVCFNNVLKIHDRMLKTMCIFQYSIVDNLRKLSKHPSPFQHLWDHASFFEPLIKEFKEDRWLFLLGNYFNSRLDDIILWIEHCKALRNERY